MNYVAVDVKRVEFVSREELKEQGLKGFHGMIEIREGVEDLYLMGGNSAIVYILLNNGTYIYGGAIYSNSLPDGIDIRVTGIEPRQVLKTAIFNEEIGAQCGAINIPKTVLERLWNGWCRLVRDTGHKERHLISLQGCHDDTNFYMRMNKKEYEFLLKLSEKANETSTYDCMPKMRIDDPDYLKWVKDAEKEEQDD